MMNKYEPLSLQEKALNRFTNLLCLEFVRFLMVGTINTGSCVRGIKLSRNRGHKNALLAGLFNAEGDAIVSIDAEFN